MNGRRHVITGGAGFVARYLARELEGLGEEVLLADVVPPAAAHVPRNARFVPCDVTSPADLRALDLRPEDVVYHLAARQFSGAVPRRGRDGWFAAVNVAGTEAVLGAMRQAGASRLVFFSTDMTYGLPQACPVPTDHPQRPLGPYGRSKVAAEGLIRRAQAESPLRATAFRPRLIAGAGRLGILARLFELIRRGLPVPLIGAGRNRYQMVSVRDCARAAARAMELGCPAGFFNLGSAAPPTARDLLGAVIRHAGSRSVLVPTPALLVKGALRGLDAVGLTLMHPEQYRIADQDVLLDTTATERALGWAPAEHDTAILVSAYEEFLAARESGAGAATRLEGPDSPI